MAVSLDQLLSAIASQESGGLKNPYGVVNSYGAVGKYQVLKSNVPSWSKAALGYSISWQTFRDSPDLQEQIVRHRMEGYYNKYGARGAASAWYSGDPNLHNSTRPQPGGPSIKSYVDSVISKASKAPAGGGASSFSGGGTVPALDSQELAEQYGFASSFLNSHWELKRLFEQAVAGGWSKDKFQAKLRDTGWFKNTNAESRKYLLEMSADPASAHMRWDNTYLKVRQLANKIGIQENPFTLNAINEATNSMIYKGWDEAALRFYLAGYIDLGYVPTQEGEAGEIYDQLHQYTYAMGVELANEWYNTNTRKIIQGVATVQDFKSEIAGLAKANYPQWKAQIEGGQTVSDIAQPYLQSMANILELPAGSVNLFDNTIKKALSYTNPSSMEKQAKPLWQFENELRSDPRWKQTKNAQDSLMQVGHKILADFGMAY